MRFYSIRLRAIAHEMLKISILDISLKIANSMFQPPMGQRVSHTREYHLFTYCTVHPTTYIIYIVCTLYCVCHVHVLTDTTHIIHCHLMALGNYSIASMGGFTGIAPVPMTLPWRIIWLCQWSNAEWRRTSKDRSKKQQHIYVHILQINCNTPMWIYRMM